MSTTGNGSSPRARGTRESYPVRLIFDRFIPAGAGNTSRPPISTARSAVHPRGRGEHIIWFLSLLLITGSSPRARGTPLKVGIAGGVSRFIPAGAGNTFANHDGVGPGTVHPRGRGEHCLLVRGSTEPTGSSPRARGTPGPDRSRAARGRFIPAGAGNTQKAQIWVHAATVHPRGRGEHEHHLITELRGIGSSPRARGTLFDSPVSYTHTRFIPAGAGNT